MTLDEFANDGFLQEANRQFFHPLGLALAVARDSETGEALDLRIWDARDDPEGILFTDEYMASEEALEKAVKVAETRIAHRVAREALMGGIIQPLGFVLKRDPKQVHDTSPL